MTVSVDQLIEGIKELGDIRKISTAELVAELSRRFVIPVNPDYAASDDDNAPQIYIAPGEDVITL